MDKNQNKTSWWRPGAEIFGEVSTWVVVPIVLALVLGKYLDSHFDTKPWIFLGLTGVSFFISSFGIVRVVSKYLKTIQKEDEQNNLEKNNGK